MPNPVNAGVHRVRLEREVNLVAWTKARVFGVRKDRWIASLIENYAAGPMPKKPPKVTIDERDLVQIRVHVDDEVWDRASARAKAEGADLSRVVERIVTEIELPS